MSKENVEVVRACLEAWQRGDEAAAMEAFGPEIEFRLVSAAVGGDVFRGREGFREWVAAGEAAFEHTEIGFRDLMDAGDEVVLRLSLRARGRANGIETAIEYSAVFTLDQGKIVRYREFPSRKAALEAAGLREQAMSEEN